MVVNQLLKYGEFGIVLFDNFQVTERTRNQFVDNTTRGFESLPLRQDERNSNRVTFFVFLSQLLIFSKRYGIIIKNASEDIIVELALSIVSLVVGVVSIALAIVSMVSTTRTEKRILKITKTIRKLIDGKEDET